jgi:hypothetical protein
MPGQHDAQMPASGTVHVHAFAPLYVHMQLEPVQVDTQTLPGPSWQVVVLTSGPPFMDIPVLEQDVAYVDCGMPGQLAMHGYWDGWPPASARHATTAACSVSQPG